MQRLSSRKDDLLALAHGGTVFLDAVGELPLETQGMLLREAGWVEPADLRIADDARPGQPAEAGEVPVPPRPVVAAPLPADRRRETALRMAREQGAVSRRQLAARCGVSGETARVELGLLARLGLLRPVGRGAATRYVPA